jgi:hypothetical protein
MTSSLKELRAAVEAGRTAGGRLRSGALLEVRRLIRDASLGGMTYAAIASAVDVTEQTIRRWRAADRGAVLAPVRIVDAPPPMHALIVYGPRGLRVEGLSVDDLATLLCRLSP